MNVESCVRHPFAQEVFATAGTREADEGQQHLESRQGGSGLGLVSTYSALPSFQDPGTASRRGCGDRDGNFAILSGLYPLGHAHSNCLTCCQGEEEGFLESENGG
jgi:hypothetical protein